MAIFLVLCFVSFVIRIFWTKTQLPFDFTFGFFFALIIAHKLGFLYLVLFVLLGDLIPGSIIMGGFDPLSLATTVSIILTCGLSTLIGGNLIFAGIIAALIHFPLSLFLKSFMGYLNVLSTSWAITGFLFTVMYLYKFWPLMQGIF